MPISRLPAIVSACYLCGCVAGTVGDGGQSVDETSDQTSIDAIKTNNGAVDPGPRPGPAGAGAPATTQPIDPDSSSAQAQAAVACFPGLAAAALAFCEQAIIRFQEIDSVSGAIEAGKGLGPTYNANGCAACHSQPSVLGSSIGPTSPQLPGAQNPQIALATLDGATNTVPAFITAAGPVREARFKSDGGVHDLFTIAGRKDAPGCKATQPDFAAALRNHDVIFRIPIATFGDGLVENIPDAALEANVEKSADYGLGIAGVLNRSGNDGTVTRFGWKAQNKSLLVFAGEAYNVEQGVTNVLFNSERTGGAGNLDGCLAFNPTPEDNTNFAGSGKNTVSDVSSDVLNFAAGMSLSAPPVPALPPNTSAATVANGQALFLSIGCAHCHTQSFTTAASSFDPALSHVELHPFSDFALHHMGNRLADGISQGNAGHDQFRTAPLWGAGQRLFFLHDGRTQSLVTAIEAHASGGSEANRVIDKFNDLRRADQQAILSFLRSL
jgi:CxxC motif-containing protein (DUF1111 family)